MLVPYKDTTPLCRCCKVLASFCSSNLCGSCSLLQQTAQQKVSASVSKVEAALHNKLASTQALAQGLQRALSAVDHELGGLSRAQQRLSSMLAHVKQKAALNHSRQQVRPRQTFQLVYN